MEYEEELIATNEGGGGIDLPPHPAGPFAGVCIDVIDRGTITELNKFEGNKEHTVHKLTLRFFCGEYFDGPDGKRHPLWLDKWFRLSMHEKASLRKFVNQWRGVPVTEEEARRFNVAKMLHAPALIQVAHNVQPTRTYANIDSIMRLMPGMVAPAIPTDYVRVKDRPPREEAKQSPIDALAHAQRRDVRQATSAPAHTTTVLTPPVPKSWELAEEQDPLPF